MFEVRELARQACKAAKPIFDAAKDAETKDQLRRAALSMVLNLNEANARKGKDKDNRFSMAEGSAREAQAAIETAMDWKYVTEEEGREAWALFDRTIAMLVRLRFPRRKQGAEKHRKSP